MTDPSRCSRYRRRRDDVDLERIERAVREILEAIGEDPDRDGLRPHARRASRDMYEEIFAGLHEDPSQHLTVTFEADHDEMVMVRDIPLHSACASTTSSRSRQGPRRLHPRRRRPHHRAVEDRPPGRRASPGARRCRSGSPPRSPTRWSRCSSPTGVLVVIEAEHLCMSMRGVRKPGSLTDHVRGARACSRTTPATRAEAMSLITLPGKPPVSLELPNLRRRDRSTVGTGPISCPQCSPGRTSAGERPAGDGHRQRHARLLLRRRPVPRPRRRGRPRPRAGRRRAPTCSTSAASRPGPAPSRSTTHEELRRVLPVVERAGRRGRRAR